MTVILSSSTIMLFRHIFFEHFLLWSPISDGLRYRSVMLWEEDIFLVKSLKKLPKTRNF